MHQTIANYATGKTGVVAHANWINAFHQFCEPVQMPGVCPGSGAQGQAYAMQANRIASPATLQHDNGSATLREEILGMDLQKFQLGSLFQSLFVMAVTPTYANFHLPVENTFDRRHGFMHVGELDRLTLLLSF